MYHDYASEKCQSDGHLHLELVTLLFQGCQIFTGIHWARHIHTVLKTETVVTTQTAQSLIECIPYHKLYHSKCSWRIRERKADRTYTSFYHGCVEWTNQIAQRWVDNHLSTYKFKIQNCMVHGRRWLYTSVTVAMVIYHTATVTEVHVYNLYNVWLMSLSPLVG